MVWGSGFGVKAKGSGLRVRVQGICVIPPNNHPSQRNLERVASHGGKLTILSLGLNKHQHGSGLVQGLVFRV